MGDDKSSLRKRLFEWYGAAAYLIAMVCICTCCWRMVVIAFKIAGYPGAIGAIVVSPVTFGVGPWVVAFAYGMWLPLIIGQAVPAALFAIGSVLFKFVPTSEDEAPAARLITCPDALAPAPSRHRGSQWFLLLALPAVIAVGGWAPWIVAGLAPEDSVWILVAVVSTLVCAVVIGAEIVERLWSGVESAWRVPILVVFGALLYTGDRLLLRGELPERFVAGTVIYALCYGVYLLIVLAVYFALWLVCLETPATVPYRTRARSAIRATATFFVVIACQELAFFAFTPPIRSMAPMTQQATEQPAAASSVPEKKMSDVTDVFTQQMLDAASQPRAIWSHPRMRSFEGDASITQYVQDAGQWYEDVLRKNDPTFQRVKEHRKKFEDLALPLIKQRVIEHAAEQYLERKRNPNANPASTVWQELANKYTATKTERKQSAVASAAGARNANTAPRVEDAAEKEFTNSIGMKVVRILPGKFLMGSSDDEEGRSDNEGPQHEVHITKPFYIGKYEVTRGQFRRFTADTGYQTRAEWEGTGAAFNKETMSFYLGAKGASWRNPGFEQTDQHPVVNVSWEDAQAFCAWLTRKDGREYRLPSEAEWEYACRAATAPSSTRFHGGNSDTHLAVIGNIADWSLRAQLNLSIIADKEELEQVIWTDRHPFTAPVGRFEANAFGLYDMHGNVAEWCEDWYEPGYYSTSPKRDPKGPDTGWFRIGRGGSFRDSPRTCRAATRLWSKPTSHHYAQGFRVVCIP